MRDIKRGEVYYADLNPVRGSEQGRIRPVVIVQNDTGNKFSPTTIVAALNNITKKHTLPTHVVVDCDFLEKESIVPLEQIHTINKSRLTDYLGSLNSETMDRIDQAIEISFGLHYLEGLSRA